MTGGIQLCGCLTLFLGPMLWKERVENERVRRTCSQS